MSLDTTYKIRPYARLLTMLGEQLIKDERIALIEIIKNSYDADADWVKITFKDFGPGYKYTKESKIIIEDSGDGMTKDVIENHWLNPATPVKVHKKELNDKTKKGRVIQGEKGIGRFALLKLGRKISIITRTQNENLEHVITYDFSVYDDEFLTEKGIQKDLFLDELSVSISSREPEIIIEKEILLGARKLIKPNHGTRIEISDLKGTWSAEKVQFVYNDLNRLQPIFFDVNKDKLQFSNGFGVWIYFNDEFQKLNEDYIEKLNFLLKNRSVIFIEDGVFDADQQQFTYKENGVQKVVSLYDPELTGLTVYKRFKKPGINLEDRVAKCGSFHFGFYIFDFNHNAPKKYELDKEDKKTIKDHRIYLYRDGIRVYPYGDPDDDWLRIDQFRGTIAAGYFLSNDQVVGYINITRKGNPKLLDKTNREGLIEEGDTTEDFLTLIQIFLAFLRKGPYTRYLKDNENKKDAEVFRNNLVQNKIDELKQLFKNDKKVLPLLTNTENIYKTERSYLVRRAEITEDLAGVGLSVETASHDILGIMSKVFANLDGLIRDLLSADEIDKDELLKDLQSVRGGMSFIEAQLKDIQLLFTSSKQRAKQVRIKEILEKVERLYRRMLTKESIDFSVEIIGSPLMAKTTDAVLLQLLLNLFDNSIYWLQQTSTPNKQIKVILDGQKGRMIFSDNGPGVKEDDVPYIFEPFYSGKGEEGRGLGLYIARQLLERYDYSIELIELKSQKILSGANFLVSFLGKEK